MTEESFWRSTPRQIERAFRAAAIAAEREHNLRAWHTWHGAALPRMKTFPKLEKLQHRKRPKRQMTPDEMWAVMLPMTYSRH